MRLAAPFVGQISVEFGRETCSVLLSLSIIELCGRKLISLQSWSVLHASTSLHLSTFLRALSIRFDQIFNIPSNR
jgi:hypothetical protein